MTVFDKQIIFKRFSYVQFYQLACMFYEQFIYVAYNDIHLGNFEIVFKKISSLGIFVIHQ